MKLDHLDPAQRQAVRTGAVDLSTVSAICGTSVIYKAGATRCEECLMPVELDASGSWVYAS